MDQNSFLGLEGEYSSYDKSKFVILPVPFDKTSTWLKGADKGPDAIIEASKNLEVYDIETDSEVYKKGIFTAEPVVADNPEKMVEMVHDKVKELLDDNKFVVMLGGEHSISAAAVKSHSEKFEGLSVLQLDAHSDRRDSYDGSKYNHACVMARVKEMVDKIVSVGIRSMDSSEKESLAKDKVFFARDIKGDSWIKEAVNGLSDNVYVTIDLDVFDPAVMPSTGTPEPGGLDWYTVTKLLREVSKSKNIVGFDVVELCPSENKAPDFTAAKLVYKLMSYYL